MAGSATCKQSEVVYNCVVVQGQFVYSISLDIKKRKLQLKTTQCTFNGINQSVFHDAEGPSLSVSKVLIIWIYFSFSPQTFKDPRRLHDPSKRVFPQKTGSTLEYLIRRSTLTEHSFQKMKYEYSKLKLHHFLLLRLCGGGSPDAPSSPR